MKSKLAVGVCILGLASCGESGVSIGGSVIGASLCSALASELIDDATWRRLAVSAGTATCAYGGAQLARMLTSGDLDIAGRATKRAAETNETQTWNNPETGAKGTVTPRVDPTDASCSIADQKAETADGEVAEDSVRMCKNASGTWIVDI